MNFSGKFFSLIASIVVHTSHGFQRNFVPRSLGEAISPWQSDVNWVDSSTGSDVNWVDSSIGLVQVPPSLIANKLLNPVQNGDFFIEVAFKISSLALEYWKNSIFSAHSSFAGWEIRTGVNYVTFLWTINPGKHVELFSAEQYTLANQWVHVMAAHVAKDNQLLLFVNGDMFSKYVPSGSYFWPSNDMPKLGQNAVWSDRKVTGLIAYASASNDLPVSVGELSDYAKNMYNNRLNVLDPAPTVSPTLSFQPTPAPTTSLPPTPAPTVTFNPSLSPTFTHPNITAPLLEVSFDDASTDNEITLSYTKTYHRAEASLLKKNCAVDDDIEATWISMTDETLNGEKGYKVKLDMKPEAIDIDQNKVVFNNTDPEVTTIEFCVRVDLYLDVGDGDESVTFQQTIVEVTANTTQGFEVNDVSLSTDTETVSKTKSFDYAVTANQCNRAGEEDGTVVKQSESVFICVETTSEASIKEVKSLVFWGGSQQLTAIRDGTPNAVTSKRALSNKKHIVQSRLVSRFYSNTEQVVTANGAVVMGFAGSTAGRRLQQTDSVGGDAGGGESGFDVVFNLAPLENGYVFEEDNSPASVMSTLGFLTIGFVSIMVMELI